MLNENIKMSGQLEIWMVDQNGKEKYRKIFPNLVVQTGREFVAQRIISNNAIFMSHIAVGSGSETPNISDTTLGEEIVRSQISSANSTSNTISFVAPFLPGIGTGAITEAGIFNSHLTDSGIMLCRTTFPVVNKEDGDTLTITWNVSPS